MHHNVQTGTLHDKSSDGLSSYQSRNRDSSHRTDGSRRSEGMSLLACTTTFEVRKHPFGRQVRCNNDKNE